MKMLYSPFTLGTALLSVGLAIAGAADGPGPSVIANTTNQFTIAGMHCSGCARGLESELKSARGVASAQVSLTNKLAVVAYDARRTSISNLLQVVVTAGFEGKLFKPEVAP